MDVATSLPLGQVVGSLIPNTNYVCFAAATYEDNGSGGTQYACSAPSALTATVAPPTVAATRSVISPTTAIRVSGTPPNGDAVPIAYAVQCLEAAGPPPYACDTAGTWEVATNLATGQ